MAFLLSTSIWKRSGEVMGAVLLQEGEEGEEGEEDVVEEFEPLEEVVPKRAKTEKEVVVQVTVLLVLLTAQLLSKFQLAPSHR